MEILKLILEIIKEFNLMSKQLSIGRFLLILMTILLSFLIWKSPEILDVLLKSKG